MQYHNIHVTFHKIREQVGAELWQAQLKLILQRLAMEFLADLLVVAS